MRVMDLNVFLGEKLQTNDIVLTIEDTRIRGSGNDVARGHCLDEWPAALQRGEVFNVRRHRLEPVRRVLAGGVGRGNIAFREGGAVKFNLAHKRPPEQSNYRGKGS